MKKSAILLALCIAALTGCGRVDSVDVDSDITPFKIESTTQEEDEEASTDISAPKVTGTAVTSENAQGTVTTARTGAVNLVKRTGVAATAKRTAAPSRGTAAVPQRPSGGQRPSNSTAAPSTTTTAVVTTVIVSTAPPVTTIPDEENPAVVVRDDMTCRIKENGIEVTLKGEPVQIIDISTQYMLNAYENGIADASSLVSINDFDFDGYYDLFVPQSKSEDNLNTYGKFLRFNPETNLFEESASLSQLQTLPSTVDNGTLSATVRFNDTEYETKTYEWKVVNEETGEKELTLVRMIKQFRLDSSPDNQYDVFIDYYEYTNGVKNTVKREKLIFNENGEYVGTQEIEIEWLI